LHDIVHHFRNQGIQVAFAMVGNRVERTMRKSHLFEFVGEQWFFPTVNGAVHYCLQHQQSSKRAMSMESMQSAAFIPVHGSSEVHLGNEIGFSNDLHHECTAVFINSLHCTDHGFVGDVLSAFRQSGVSITRTQVESSSGGVEKHFYLVKDASTLGKLTDERMEHLHQEFTSLFEEARHVGISAPNRLPHAEPQ
jgi:hypothetical protein